jgi:hypothetical protein
MEDCNCGARKVGFAGTSSFWLPSESELAANPTFQAVRFSPFPIIR